MIKIKRVALPANLVEYICLYGQLEWYDSTPASSEAAQAVAILMLVNRPRDPHVAVRETGSQTRACTIVLDAIFDEKYAESPCSEVLHTESHSIDRIEAVEHTTTDQR